MPEGDTIFRAARTLHRALADRVVSRFESVFPALTRVHHDAPLTGRTIDRVEAVAEMLDLELLDLPANLWRRVESLPDIHGDPVDRMLIAHAIQAGLTLVTADRTMRKYPVPTLW